MVNIWKSSISNNKNTKKFKKLTEKNKNCQSRTVVCSERCHVSNNGVSRRSWSTNHHLFRTAPTVRTHSNSGSSIIHSFTLLVYYYMQANTVKHLFNKSLGFLSGTTSPHVVTCTCISISAVGFLTHPFMIHKTQILMSNPPLSFEYN